MTWQRSGPYSSFLFHCYSHPNHPPRITRPARRPQAARRGSFVDGRRPLAGYSPDSNRPGSPESSSQVTRIVFGNGESNVAANV